MKKNFDTKKLTQTIQGADGNSGKGGNVNPAAQDKDRNTVTGVKGGREYVGACSQSMNYDGGPKHNYTDANELVDKVK